MWISFVFGAVPLENIICYPVESNRGQCVKDYLMNYLTYFSGVNSDSSATLVVGVFRSNRVGVRDLLRVDFASN
jgi:hypothetical protein